MKWLPTLLSAMILFMASAGIADGGNAVARTAVHSKDCTQPQALPLPELPPNISDPDRQKEYFLDHFWDALDFRDTLMSHDRDFMEQKFSNFAKVMATVDNPETLKSGVQKLMSRAQTDTAAYLMLAEIAGSYLYDPNSPMLDEESYIPFLEILSSSDLVDEAARGRYGYLLEAAMKNRRGAIAADFPFETCDGRHLTLYGIQAPGHILLVFYDPDCDNCREIMGRMAKSPELNNLIEQGKLSVVAIYSGEEKELWQRTAGILPEKWIVGFDNGAIDQDELYVFPTSPAIYILDSEKRVIVKDLSPEKLP